MMNYQLGKESILLSDLLDMLFELEDFRIKYMKNLDNAKKRYEAETYMQKVKLNFAESILKSVEDKMLNNRDKDILYDVMMLYCDDKFTKEEVMHLISNVEDETVVEQFYQRI